MSTKTLDFKSLTTKLTTEIFSFQFSIFNFIEPPGNAYTRTFAFSHLSFAIRQKKAFTSCPTSKSGSFFLCQQTTDYSQQFLCMHTCGQSLLPVDC